MPKEQDAAFYSSLGSRYEAAFGHDQGLVQSTLKALSHLRPNSHVLDLGCGTGTPVAASIVNAGHRITGIDISDVMVELARKAVPTGTFEVADIDGNAGRGGDGEAVGRVAAEDCHPETQGVEYDEDGLCARGIPWRFMGNATSIDLFTRRGWDKLLADAGFEIVETMTDVFVPPSDAGCDSEPHYFIVARKGGG